MQCSTYCCRRPLRKVPSAAEFEIAIVMESRFYCARGPPIRDHNQMNSPSHLFSPNFVRGHLGEEYRVLYLRFEVDRPELHMLGENLRAARSISRLESNNAHIDQILHAFRVPTSSLTGRDGVYSRYQQFCRLVERGMLRFEQAQATPLWCPTPQRGRHESGHQQTRRTKPRTQGFLIYVAPGLLAEHSFIPLTVPPELAPPSFLRPHARPIRLMLSLTQNATYPVYNRGATLKFSGKGRVRCYADEALTEELGPRIEIEGHRLNANRSLDLWLVGATEGELTAQLEVRKPKDQFVLDKPYQLDLQVIELTIQSHKHDHTKIAKLAANPDVPDRSQYLNALKALKIPDQIPLKRKVQREQGRILHKQVNQAHGKARLVIPKLSASKLIRQVPRYWVEIRDSSRSGSLSFFAKEDDSKPLPVPHKIPLSDLLSRDHEVWVQGDDRCEKSDDAAVELYLNRSPGGPDFTPVPGVDVALFTVVEIVKVHVDEEKMNANIERWAEAGPGFDCARLYINLLKGRRGRKLHVVATLDPPIPKLQVHFALIEDEFNRRKKNWGIDLPKKWKWHRISRSLKHKDKAKRTSFLHRKGNTDDEGRAEQTLYASRFGGDKFELVAYIAQDPHLAKYTPEDSELAETKPARADLPFQVWRAFWCQVSKPQGVNPPSPPKASIEAYKSVKVEMRPSRMSRTYGPQDFSQQIFYPRYQFEATSDKTLVSVLGFHNWSDVKKMAPPDPTEQLKSHAMVCRYYCDQTNRLAKSKARLMSVSSSRSFDVYLSGDVIDPPLQGGNLLVSGRWQVRSGGRLMTGKLLNSHIDIVPQRKQRNQIRVTLPPQCPTPTTAQPILVTIKCRSYDGPFLGLSDGNQTLVVYDPKDPVDYQDTITHETAHSFGQTPLAGDQPRTIPPHPNAYISDGVHCNYGNQQCVMFEAQTHNFALHKFCPVCHPYLLVQDMSRMT